MSAPASFQWKSETNSILGQITKPVAVIGIRDSGGYWKNFTFKIDSGADITAMNASDCELLGYNILDGDRVEVSRVGGQRQIGFIHKLDMRIGQDVLEDVRILFLMNRISELLLGRLEVFYNYNIGLSGRFGNTNFVRE